MDLRGRLVTKYHVAAELRHLPLRSGSAACRLPSAVSAAVIALVARFRVAAVAASAHVYPCGPTPTLFPLLAADAREQALAQGGRAAVYATTPLSGLRARRAVPLRGGPFPRTATERCVAQEASPQANTSARRLCCPASHRLALPPPSVCTPTQDIRPSPLPPCILSAIACLPRPSRQMLLGPHQSCPPPSWARTLFPIPTCGLAPTRSANTALHALPPLVTNRTSDSK